MQEGFSSRTALGYLPALLGLLLAAPSPAAESSGTNPFLAEAQASGEEDDRTGSDSDKAKDEDDQDGEDSAEGWGDMGDEDPMAPDSDGDQLGKCGRCFGGDG